VALVLGLIAWRRRSKNPEEASRGAVLVSIVLGGILTITSWVGVGLIILGLSSLQDP